MTQTTKRILSIAVSVLPLVLGAEAYAQATDVDCSKCVDSKDLNAKSVITGKLGDKAVTTNKIATEAVTTGRIAQQAVTTSKIAPKAVTSKKIGLNAVGVKHVGPIMKADIGSFCETGQVVVGKDFDGTLVCEDPAGSASTWAAFDFPTGGTNIESACSGEKYIKQSDFSPYFYVGAQLCSSTRYKLFLAPSAGGIYWEIADGDGFGADHCELIGGTTATDIGTNEGSPPEPSGFFRSSTGQAFQWASPPGEFFWRTSYYECGITIP